MTEAGQSTEQHFYWIDHIGGLLLTVAVAEHKEYSRCVGEVVVWHHVVAAAQRLHEVPCSLFLAAALAEYRFQ